MVDKRQKESVVCSVVAALIVAIILKIATIFWQRFPYSLFIVLTVLVFIIAICYISYVCFIKRIMLFDGNYFIGWVGSIDGIRYASFQTKIKNVSFDYIKYLNGNLVSCIDGSKSRELYIVIDGELVSPSDVWQIPRGSWFDISIPFYEHNKYEEYLTDMQLLKKWGEFVLNIECDGRHYEKKYKSDKMLKQLNESRSAVFRMYYDGKTIRKKKDIDVKK